MYKLSKVVTPSPSSCTQVPEAPARAAPPGKDDSTRFNRRATPEPAPRPCGGRRGLGQRHASVAPAEPPVARAAPRPVQVEAQPTMTRVNGGRWLMRRSVVALLALSCWTLVTGVGCVWHGR